MRRLLLIPLLFCSSWLSGTDLKPWFPRYLEFQSSFTYLHQQYYKVDEGARTIHWRSKDDFYHTGLELAYDDLCGELELTFSSTKRHHLGPDNAKATLRYQVLDDIIGDPVSLVAGVTVSQVFALSLKDISTFNHGGIEGEFHLSVGAECPCWDTWTSRWWAVGGIGLGDHGSPWLHGELAWEKNWCEQQHFRLFAEAIYGLGDENLDVFIFDGYGPIRHQSIDLGAMYRYTFECDGSLSLGYAHRLHARNCPENANIYYVTYEYPFGL
jgi:hypothetical protein